MSCCDSTDKIPFLETKAKNFKALLLKYNPDATVMDLIENFKPSSLISTILTYVVPIIASGTLDASVCEMMTHLTVPTDEQKEVKAKLKLYLVMFNEVVLA